MARVAASLAVHRLDVQAGDHSFRSLVLAEDLVLAADLLSVHAHWITPEDSPRASTTIFFAAVTPPGQEALHDGVELTDHVWLRPEQGLAQYRAGKRQMILPTWANLETLLGFDSASAAARRSRGRPIVPILPVLREREGKRRIEIPAGAGYPTIEELARLGRTEPTRRDPSTSIACGVGRGAGREAADLGSRGRHATAARPWRIVLVTFPAPSPRRRQRVIALLPAAANSGQSRAIGRSSASTPRSTSTCAQSATSGFATENGMQSVSRCTARRARSTRARPEVDHRLASEVDARRRRRRDRRARRRRRAPARSPGR